MAFPASPDIALLATHNQDAVPSVLFDNRKMEPGNHLRWVLRSDLGLPERFILHRSGNQDIIEGISRIYSELKGKNYTEVILPRVCAYIRSHSKPFAELRYAKWDALEWLTAGSPEAAGLRMQFQGSASQLRSGMARMFECSEDWRDFNPRLIQNMHQKTFEQTGSSRRTRMRLLDGLQLAALDPYVARMTGFYFIDRTAYLPAHGYLIEADYADRRWPLHQVEPRRPQGFAVNQPMEALEGVTAMPLAGRLIYEWSAEEAAALLGIRSNVAPALRLKFSEKVQEVFLTLKGDRSDDCKILMDGAPEGFTYTSLLTHGNNRQLEIRGAAYGFERLDFRFTSPGTWKIIRISWRRKTGAMGLISSPCTLVNRSEQPALPPPPVLTACSAMPSPLMLTTPGEVRTGLSDVRLSFLAQPVMTQPESPVRMLYGRADGETVVPLNPKELAVIPKSDPALPALLLWLPLNGSLVNMANGNMAQATGNIRFTRTGGRRNTVKSAFFDGSSTLSLPEDTQLRQPGNAFSVYIKIKASATLPDQTYTPLFDNGSETGGFRLGIWKSGEYFLLRVYVNGHFYQSEAGIPPETWCEAGASYNGSRLRLDVNGLVKEQEASHGAIAFHPGGTGLGGRFDNGYIPSRPYFTGHISDVHCWNQWIDRQSARQMLSGNASLFPQRFAATPLLHLPGQRIFNGTNPLIFDLPALNYLGKELSIHTYLYLRAGGSFPTIAGNDFGSSFWWGIEEPGKQLKLWLNGRYYLSHRSIPLDRWVRVGVVIRMKEVTFYVDGAYDVSRPIPDETIRPNAGKQGLRVGGDTNNSYLLHGAVCDLKLYTYAVDPGNAAGHRGIFNFTDRAVPDGVNLYRARNIDLFGRISDWGTASARRTNAVYVTNAPLGLQGQIVQVKAKITDARFEAPAEGKAYGRWIAEFGPGPDTRENAILDAFLTGRPIPGLLRHEILASRIKEPSSHDDMTPGRKIIRQHFEIESFNADQKTVLLKEPLFSQLQLQRGDDFEILFDYGAYLQWQWSGLQQVFNPGVNSFSVFRLQGSPNETHGQVRSTTTITPNQWEVKVGARLPSPAAKFNGGLCSIDKQVYVVESCYDGSPATIRLRYDGYPVIVPAEGADFVMNTPEDHPAWKDLSIPSAWGTEVRQQPADTFSYAGSTSAVADFHKTSRTEVTEMQEKGIGWLQHDQTLWTLQLHGFDKPENVPDLSVNDYVPGALVVNCVDKDEWEAWYVHWHEWRDPHTLVCWVSLKTEGRDILETPPPVRISATHPVRFYIGRKYTCIVPFPVTGATLTWQFSVAARVLSSPHTFTMSRQASVVTVDRRRPEKAPPPEIVSISGADVHGISLADIRWAPAAGPVTGFNLYRATDAAIISCDLDQRRLLTGHYATANPFAEDSPEDPDGDIHEFLRAVRHKVPEIFAPDFRAAFGKPLAGLTLGDLSGHPKGSTRWQALNPVWQYWALRFYPALSAAEMQEIAGRKGNEQAFTLVNDLPVSNAIKSSDERVFFIDQIRGVVSNRYFYRLRVMGATLALSSEWGDVSEGKAVRIPGHKPQAPVWLGANAGDRKIHIGWALNREQDLKEYVLYQSADISLLDDLRWFDFRFPSGNDLVQRTVIPDMRLVAEDRSLTLTFPSSPARITGVYLRSDIEVPFEAGNSGSAQFNYYNGSFVQSPSDPALYTLSLRRIASGTEVVCLYETVEGEAVVHPEESLSGAASEIPTHGAGRKHFVLKAVMRNGVQSALSEKLTGESYNDLRPPARDFLLSSTGAQVILDWETSTRESCAIERKETEYGVWNSISSWLEPGTDRYTDENVRTGITYYYRLKVKDETGRMNTEFIEKNLII